MEESLIPVNVWLAGRSYRIRIRPEEEERVRGAVKAADDRIAELRLHYAGKDDQDFLAMCLLMYATEITTNTAAPTPPADTDTEQLRKEIERLSALIDRMTGNQEE